MHKEIQVRVELQEKLYTQNDLMFQYVTELFKAQKRNARTMKTHVLELQQQLQTLQEERQVLVDKITVAQGTKEAIQGLEAQQENLEQKIVAAQEARRAAVASGQQQSAENQV